MSDCGPQPAPLGFGPLVGVGRWSWVEEAVKRRMGRKRKGC